MHLCSSKKHHVALRPCLRWVFAMCSHSRGECGLACLNVLFGEVSCGWCCIIILRLWITIMARSTSVLIKVSPNKYNNVCTLLKLRWAYQISSTPMVYFPTKGQRYAMPTTVGGVKPHQICYCVALIQKYYSISTTQ